jgi:hypothetical protein
LTAIDVAEGAPKLPQLALKAALSSIAAWQQKPTEAARCPVCHAVGLKIVDRSARPYTAWFGLSCGACGLEDTISYPLGGTGNTWS